MVPVIPCLISQAAIIGVVLHNLLFRDFETSLVFVLAIGQVKHSLSLFTSQWRLPII